MKNNKVVVINYGMGNLLSIKRKFDALGSNCVISANPKDIETADKLVLPGVGHFGKAMLNLKNYDLYELLNERVITHEIPVLGICLGMQLMTKFSEEGNSLGFGWIDAEVVRFNVQNKLKYKVPQVGWNQIQVKKDSKLSDRSFDGAEFYFVHSYHVVCNNSSDILHTTKYEYDFTSAFSRNNIFGVQYHPEKSHKKGLQLLKNFLDV